LGSNVGDSKAYIAKAVDLLGQSVRDIVQAPLYTSKAVGYTDQPDFINTAVRGTTSLSPTELLHFVKAIEQEIGRIYRFRWGPREIDIDVIYYDDVVFNSPELTIPHPRCRERDFVLRPIADIDPSYTDPVAQRSVSDLLALLSATERSIQ
jgi:2-amino-4-hydroxy-6-hydroxymethyldihydropteridine diphosphokinase